MALAIPIRSMSEALMQRSDVQAQVLEMHAREVPLADMVEQLGLGDQLTPDIRSILEGLAPDTVAAIRQTIVDWVNNGGGDSMPINCEMSVNVQSLSGGASVEVVDTSGSPTIEVIPT